MSPRTPSAVLSVASDLTLGFPFSLRCRDGRCLGGLFWRTRSGVARRALMQITCLNTGFAGDEHPANEDYPEGQQTDIEALLFIRTYLLGTTRPLNEVEVL